MIKQKSMLPPLCVSFTPHFFMHAWRRKEEGVERSGSAYVNACLFVCAPCAGASVGLLPSVLFSGWTWACSSAACAVSQRIPWRRTHCLCLTTSRLGQGGEETPRGRRCKSQWDLRENRHTSTVPCKHTPICVQTLNKSPGCETKRLIMPLNKAVALTWSCVHCEVDVLSRES